MNISSVGLGIILFLCALVLLWKTYRLTAVTRLRPFWAALGVFIVFFLIGYAVFLATLIRGDELTGLRPLIAQIFLWGSIFVLLCSWLFLATVQQRLRIEEDLRSAQEQVERSQRMEAMGLVAGGIAHDFNNFLTAIIGLSEIGIASSENSDITKDDFSQILETSRKASSLTRQLLAFSGGQVMNPVTTQLTDILKGQAQVLKSIIGEDIELSISSTTDACAHLDIIQFERVLLNMTINARDAMPNGGTLSIELSETNDLGKPELLLTIKDTGRGIQPDHSEEIFTPFFTTNQASGSHGLGLATVHGILQQHSGSVETDTSYTEGAKFLIRLPKQKSDGSQPLASQQVETSRANKSRTGTDILVVDDDPAIRNMIVRHLQSEGYSAVAANNYSQAIAEVTRLKDTLSLVITDIVMPGQSGIQLAQWLNEWQARLPILFITGYSRDSEKLAHLPATSAVCHKPFLRETLLQKVSEALASRELDPR